MRGDGRRGAPAPLRVPRVAGRRARADEAGGRPGRTRRDARADGARRAAAGRGERPPQARHGDGPVGPLRAHRPGADRRRPDDPSRDRGHRPWFRAGATRAVSPGNRVVCGSLRAARRKQRRCTHAPRDTSRRGALRDRAVRDRPVRRRRRALPLAACAALGVGGGAGAATRAGRVDGVRPSDSSRPSRRGSGSCPWGTATGSGGT